MNNNPLNDPLPDLASLFPLLLKEGVRAVRRWLKRRKRKPVRRKKPKPGSRKPGKSKKRPQPNRRAPRKKR